MSSDQILTNIEKSCDIHVYTHVIYLVYLDIYHDIEEEVDCVEHSRVEQMVPHLQL